MENNEEENIIVCEKISIQREENLVNTEIKECNEANDDVNEEETIKKDE